MQLRNLARNLLAIALLSLFVVACAGGGAAAAQPERTTGPSVGEPADMDQPTVEDAADAVEPGTALDACQLITADDVAAAMDIDDVPPGTLELSPTVLSPGRTECTYQMDGVGLIVALTPEDGANLYDAAVGAYDLVEIDGLGDGAFWSETSRRGFVWQGKVTAMFTLFTSGDKAAIIERLGKAMLAKL